MTLNFWTTCLPLKGQNCKHAPPQLTYIYNFWQFFPYPEAQFIRLLNEENGCLSLLLWRAMEIIPAVQHIEVTVGFYKGCCFQCHANLYINWTWQPPPVLHWSTWFPGHFIFVPDFIQIFRLNLGFPLPSDFHQKILIYEWILRRLGEQSRSSALSLQRIITS